MDFFNPLDAMCEVVMEESPDDAPVNLPSDEGGFDLPPIPTFDLQSEQFTYLPQPPPPIQAPIVVNKIKLPLSRAPTTPEAPWNTAPKSAEKRLKPRPLEDLLEVPITNREKSEFFQKVFNPAIFGQVFSSPDQYPKNLHVTTVDELKYYSELFSDTTKVELCRLHCTICDKHLGCSTAVANMAKQHRMLSVLTCKNCFDFYGDGKFPTDKSDNTEVYCRWCGQGGDLVCCSFCPKVFCYKCVRRNFDNGYLKKIQDVTDWACFCCAQTPLWPLRAVCRALLQYLKSTVNPMDKSSCCPRRGRKPKSLPPILPKLQEADKPVGPVQNPMVVFHAGLKRYAPMSPIIRGDATMRPRRILPSPQRPNILTRPQTTLVRPPQPGIRPPVAKLPPRQVPARMPEVYVDHSLQDYMVVRLRLPNNRDQYLRVNITGTCMRTPILPANDSFPQKSLKHAFRANRMIFQRLMNIKDKLVGSDVTNETFQAESILASLDRWKSAIGWIEEDLKHNLEIHRKKNQKNKKGNEDDVIDLDDEDDGDQMKWDFEAKSKEVFDDDSDVEIIEDDPKPGKTAETQKRKRDEDGEGPSGKIMRTSNGELPNGEAETAQSRTSGVDADASGGDDSMENVEDDHSKKKDGNTSNGESTDTDDGREIEESNDGMEGEEVAAVGKDGQNEEENIETFNERDKHMEIEGKAGKEDSVKKTSDDQSKVCSYDNENERKAGNTEEEREENSNPEISVSDSDEENEITTTQKKAEGENEEDREKNNWGESRGSSEDDAENLKAEVCESPRKPEKELSDEEGEIFDDVTQGETGEKNSRKVKTSSEDVDEVSDNEILQDSEQVVEEVPDASKRSSQEGKHSKTEKDSTLSEKEEKSSGGRDGRTQEEASKSEESSETSVRSPTPQQEEDLLKLLDGELALLGSHEQGSSLPMKTYGDSNFSQDSVNKLEASLLDEIESLTTDTPQSTPMDTT